jgi:hypothetical protein
MYATELDPLLLEPNYFQFSETPTFDELSIPTSSTLDWITFINPTINIHSASKIQTGAVLKKPCPAPIPAQQSPAMELAAKRELAELLRAELQRLEADIA